MRNIFGVRDTWYLFSYEVCTCLFVARLAYVYKIRCLCFPEDWQVIPWYTNIKAVSLLAWYLSHLSPNPVPLSEWRNCVTYCRMTIDSTVVTIARGASVSHSPGRTASWVRQYHGRPATERSYSAVLPPPPSPSGRWIWGVTGRFLAVKGEGGKRYRR